MLETSASQGSVIHGLVGTHYTVALMGNRDFFELYKYGRGGKDISGMLNACWASDTLLMTEMPQTARQSSEFRTIPVSLLCVLWQKAFANFRMVFKSYGRYPEDVFSSKSESRPVGLDGIRRN